MTEKNNSSVPSVSTNQYLIGTIPCDYCGDTIQWCEPIQCESCKSSYYCGDICRHLDESRNNHSMTTCRSSSSSSGGDRYVRRALHHDVEDGTCSAALSTCCGICRDTVSYKVTVPGCRHEFCYSCLLSYQNHAKTDASCPMCRGSLPQDVAQFYTEHMYSTFCSTDTITATDCSSICSYFRRSKDCAKNKTEEESTHRSLRTLVALETEMCRNRKNEPLCYQGRSWRRFQRAILCCKSEILYSLGQYEKALNALYNCQQIKNDQDCPLLCSDKYCFLEVSLVARCRLRLQDNEGCAQALEALKGSPLGIGNGHRRTHEEATMASSTTANSIMLSGGTPASSFLGGSIDCADTAACHDGRRSSSSPHSAYAQLLAKHAQCLYECAMTISHDDKQHHEGYGNNDDRRNALLERTVTACQVVARMDRHYPNIYSWMAFAYQELNQPTRAIQSMRKALAYDRPDQSAQVGVNLQKLKKLMGEDVNGTYQTGHHKQQAAPAPSSWVVLLLPWLRQQSSKNDHQMKGMSSNMSQDCPHHHHHCHDSLRCTPSKNHPSKDTNLFVSGAEESLWREFSLPNIDKCVPDATTTASPKGNLNKFHNYAAIVAE
mmetsp:Transcript_25665/g.39445  ORF Transcript_25665/g.39445 Transcript_25665/m.39445 type:complete len:604 (+) Transcript_25665:195-2006(+)|eukprot:CAMPEP_0195293592 /NCGR_PEP_ID=MMETSP0707-20130614/12824_1 /TAXON_ID=33640 /ORGANISM="Asterionellopsis glacialis, Strain CCMP134" /LENGTH=603 /DNA_ID=CAMNT_0040354341 /DNA_START=166 /DNA_END=1977 /DNA_ORIENTATION=-